MHCGKKLHKNYDTCQHYKYDCLSPVDLLQPLLVPNRVWADISMDFIEGLPSSRGKSVIMVVVDHLSKYAHFVPLSHSFKAAMVAQSFFHNIVKLHGAPTSIVSNRNKFSLVVFGNPISFAGDPTVHELQLLPSN